MTRTSNYISLISCLCLTLLGVALLSQQVCSMNLVEQVEQANGGSGNQKAITFAMIEQPELVVRVLENLLKNILDSALVDIQTNQK